MDLNAMISASWNGLLELLETDACVRHLFLESATECIQKTSTTHILVKSNFYKAKHGNTKESTIVVRKGVINKEMNAHALAIYKAWISMAILKAEYTALVAAQEQKSSSAVAREEIAKKRIAVRQQYEAANRAITKAAMDKKGIDLGEAYGPDDIADKLEDEEEERKAMKAQEKENRKLAKEKAEQKEEQQKRAIREFVLTTFSIEEATKLLELLKNLSAQEAEAFLRTVHNEKSAKKAPPPPPPVVQPTAPVQPTTPVQSQSLLNSLLDHDNYDEPSIQKSIQRKKNKNRDLCSSDDNSSESEMSVHMPDSPRKEQRTSGLESSMTTMSLTYQAG